MEHSSLKTFSQNLGFSHIGITTADPLSQIWRQRWDKKRQEILNLYPSKPPLEWLWRVSPDRISPCELLPNAQSAIVVLAPYSISMPTSLAKPSNAGRIARYAWGVDYHLVIKEKLEKISEFIKQTHPHQEQIVFRICVDSAPIDERNLAVRAGLGFIGWNTLLINQDVGSWVTIGVMLTSLKLSTTDPPSIETTCKQCGNCIRACPTNALKGPYQLQIERCIAYQTIENKEICSLDQIALREDRVFGCDRCQEVCPHNKKHAIHPMPEFTASSGMGPWLHESILGMPMSGKAFYKRWRHTPLARAGLKKLLSNLEQMRQAKARDETENNIANKNVEMLTKDAQLPQQE